MADDNDQDPGELVAFTEGSGRLIRRQWHEDRWYFSVVDVVGILTDTQIPRNYWSDLKRRLAQDEGFSELHAKIVQLKMRSIDGELRVTDAADVETLLRIVQSIPSPKAEPVKRWLAGVGAERLREAADDLAGPSEDQRRIYNRDRLTDHNKSLAAAADGAGGLTTRDFAVFSGPCPRGASPHRPPVASGNPYSAMVFHTAGPCTTQGVTSEKSPSHGRERPTVAA